MNLDPILTKATRLIQRKHYNRAIKILEPEVNRYHGMFTYYYLLGICYLYTSAFSVAFTYFKLARDIKMRDPSVLLGLAALYLRRGDTDRAVEFYLEVQDQDKHNKTAKRALKIIRKYAGVENFSAWIDSRRLSRIFPPCPQAPLTLGSFLVPIACLLIASTLGAGVLVKVKVLPSPFKERPAREGLSFSELAWDERDKPVEVGGSYRYVLTSSQVLDAYATARTLFIGYRDEAAKISLNRILESNASEAIKNKARLLISYMEVPGFDTLSKQDRFTYSEVIKEPVLYRDCHVIWRGMATNLEALQNTTSFNFLVGYDTRSTLEGIVLVVFNFSVPVNPEQPLEVLARIVPVVTEKGQDIRLEGVALHQAGLLMGAEK
ncbi:MAG: tetratricopeptide repeat protein [Treponema sp.]|jgi:tetratricopeptide (TPR) repeat protein|nr:tetratricopeptide repeat protein [Treponema sp.]